MALAAAAVACSDDVISGGDDAGAVVDAAATVVADGPADRFFADAATTMQATDASTDMNGGPSPATVTGTITLPGSASSKPYFIRLVTESMGVAILAPVKSQTGVTTAANTISYTFTNVAAGSYFIIAFVDVDESGGMASTTGDFRGWYGHGGDGDPPASPPLVVPEAGILQANMSLVVAP